MIRLVEKRHDNKFEIVDIDDIDTGAYTYKIVVSFNNKRSNNPKLKDFNVVHILVYNRVKMQYQWGFCITSSPKMKDATTVAIEVGETKLYETVKSAIKDVIDNGPVYILDDFQELANLIKDNNMNLETQANEY